MLNKILELKKEAKNLKEMSLSYCGSIEYVQKLEELLIKNKLI